LFTHSVRVQGGIAIVLFQVRLQLQNSLTDGFRDCGSVDNSLGLRDILITLYK